VAQPITDLVVRGVHKQIGDGAIDTTSEKGVDLRVEVPGDPKDRRRGERVYTELFNGLLDAAGRDALKI